GDAGGQPSADLAAEDPQPDEERDEAEGDDEADDEEGVDLGSGSAPEGPEPRAQRQPGDDDDVRRALDEDRSDRARDRGPEVPAQQVGAVQVSELGRNEAVHEPGQEEDLGRVAEADVHAAARQDVAPSVAPQGEG